MHYCFDNWLRWEQKQQSHVTKQVYSLNDLQQRFKNKHEQMQHNMENTEEQYKKRHKATVA
jgi:hypothetical protein